MMMAGGGDIPRFAIGPLTVPIADDVLQEWADNAQPGMRLPFAYGPAPRRDHPTFRLATRLRQAGVIEIFQPRRADGKGYDFLAERKPLRAPGSGGAQPTPATALPRTLPDEARAVLAVLERVAAAGDVCPTNGELAEAACDDNADRARYMLRLLERAGLITKAHDDAGRRVVTIVASGKSTRDVRRARA